MDYDKIDFDKMTSQGAIDYLKEHGNDDSSSVDFAEDYTDTKFADWSLEYYLRRHGYCHKGTIMANLDRGIHDTTGYYEAGDGDYGDDDSENVYGMANTLYHINRDPIRYYYTGKDLVAEDVGSHHSDPADLIDCYADPIDDEALEEAIQGISEEYDE